MAGIEPSCGELSGGHFAEHSPINDSPRERLLNLGAPALSHTELISLLLDDDAENAALTRRLLRKFRSLRTLARCEARELASVEGTCQLRGLEAMTPFDHHLRAVCGWLELGLPLEAHEEIEQIEPEMRTLTEVLIYRVAIFKKLERWGLLEVITRELCVRQPEEVRWPVLHAYATRREFSLERAVGVLMNAVQRFPEEPSIHYNLACYEAQLGQLDSARQRLATAIQMEPMFAKMALDDADLAALHEEIRAASAQESGRTPSN